MTRAASRRPRPTVRRRRVTGSGCSGSAARLALLIAVLAGGISAERAANAAGAGDASSSGARAPDIVLISLDTLRADRLGSYGYERATDPNLRWLAQRAVRYTRANTTAPWTLPAHASLFTGLYPPEHGSQMIRREPGASPKRALPLDPSLPTLAEVLAQAGYRTAGIAANFLYFGRVYGLDRGFARWTVLPGKAGVSAAPARVVSEQAIEWLRARQVERRDLREDAERPPLFLFLNYMDTHEPYNTAPVPGFSDRPVEPFSSREHKLTQALVMGRQSPVPAERIVTLSDQYDQAVANLDAGLGVLFEALRALALFDDALIVVVADHGEYLGEHRLVGHGKDVYQGAMRVPLFVKRPGQATGGEEHRLISLVHVPRLIFEATGLVARIPDDAFPHRWPAEPIFGQNRYSLWVDLRRPWGKRFDRIRQALYSGDRKFIHSSDGDHALFDLRRDPTEQRNLLGADEGLLAEWLRRMDAARPTGRSARFAPEVEQTPLSEEEKQQLRALGYID